MFIIARVARETAASRFLASCKMRPVARIVPLFFAMLTFAGCGNGLAKVSGLVTLDGQPIASGSAMHGTVNFYPATGTGVPATGIIDEAGRYVLKSGSREGIQPGEYMVSIAVNKITLPKTPSEMPQPTLITPKKYASVTESGLREEVTAGSNTFDFALSSLPDKQVH